MKSIIVTIVVGVLLFGGTHAQAAPAAGFYNRMLARGIADTQVGNFDSAVRELRIAAFGFVEAVDRFQLAHVYLAVASQRNFKAADARNSAVRVATAERLLTGTYGRLDLPADIRAEFEAIAKKSLTSAQMDTLRGKMVPATVASAPGGAIATPADSSGAVPQVAVKPLDELPLKKITAAEIPKRLKAAEAALAKNDLAGARKLFRTVLEAETIDHATGLTLAEGLYRSRDFEGALRAFARAGAIKKGEEYLRYYRAVSMFETGDYKNARLELAEALPHIEITPDVAQYRERIQSAR